MAETEEDCPLKTEKLLHLHLVTIHAMPSPQAVPLAAACLKAYLDGRPQPAHPVTVSCAEFYSATPLDDLCGAILAAAPQVVGLPLYVWNRQEGCQLATELRRRAPDLIIAAGGPEATADPEGVLRQAPFDFLVVGEGELALAEALERLAAGASLEGVAGIARPCGDAVVVTPRPPLEDLSILPSPWLAGLLDGHIAGGVVWQLSRGCSFGCDFCFDGMGDRRVRRYPLKRLEAELDYVVARGASQIFVLDSTFNQDVSRAKTLLRLIDKKAPGVHCHFEVRHELLDAEQAGLFARLTCSLQIGLQSADPEVARGVSRPFSRADFSRKIALLNDAGCIFGFDLIYGLPSDSLERFRDGLDFALSLYPNHLDIFPLSVLPGTALGGHARQLGLEHLPGPPYTLLSSPTFPAADMAQARRLGTACDILYSRGKAVAWFNAVAKALRLSPVQLLDEFARWLLQREGREVDEAHYGDEEIWQLQRSFLSDLFDARKLKRLLPLALDFVDYHYHYATAVMAVAPQPLPRHRLTGRELLSLPLSRAVSAGLACFSHNILELLEVGEPDLRGLHGHITASPSRAIIYPRDGQVCTESIDEPLFRLLQRLDGVTPCARLAADLRIPAAEARSFLRLALEEGIVTLPECPQSPRSKERGDH